MKRYVVYNDVHLYGPHELDLAKDMMIDGAASNSIYLGDNVDMNHVKKKMIPEAMQALRFFKNQFKERFIPGNHELDVVPGERSYVNSKVCFEHGDYLFWGAEKRREYMKGKTVGAGWFSRMFITATLDSLRKIFKAKYSDEFKERAYARARALDCTTVIVGHKHPKKKADFRYRGVRIIVLPRGRNVVDI